MRALIDIAAGVRTVAAGLLAIAVLGVVDLVDEVRR